MSLRNFKLYRGNDSSGQLVDYQIKVEQGMVVLDAIHRIQAKDANVSIGDNCDIASFVTINCADSHKKCIGLSEKIERRDIVIEKNVFVGSHCVIKGGAYIGHHSVIAAGTIVEAVKINPYSLVIGNPMQIKDGYYKDKI